MPPPITSAATTDQRIARPITRSSSWAAHSSVPSGAVGSALAGAVAGLGSVIWFDILLLILRCRVSNAGWHGQVLLPVGVRQGARPRACVHAHATLTAASAFPRRQR